MNSLLENQGQLFIAIFLLGYILTDVPTSPQVAEGLKSVFGHMIILLVSVYLIVRAEPMVAVLGLMALYELIRRGQRLPQILNKIQENNLVTIGPEQKHVGVNETKKVKQLHTLNQFSGIPSVAVSLEEKMIKKRLPLVSKEIECNGNYKPVLDDKMDYGVL